MKFEQNFIVKLIQNIRLNNSVRIESTMNILNGAASTINNYIPDAISSSLDPYYSAVCSQMAYLNQIGVDYYDSTRTIYADVAIKFITCYDDFADQLARGMLYLHSFIR